MRLAHAAVASAVLLVLAGCPADDAEEPTPEETPVVDPTPGDAAATPGGDVELTQSCGSELGYSIDYPEGWHSNEGTTVPDCTLFDPHPISVEEGTQLPIDIAVSIRLEPVEAETILEADETVEETAREETEVAQRRAWIVETVATGSGLLAEGTASYRYIIDLDAETLIVETYDEGAMDFEEKRDLLDEMVRTMSFGS